MINKNEILLVNETKVLWVSKNQMTQAQEENLCHCLKSKAVIRHYKKRDITYEDVVYAAHNGNFDIIALGPEYFGGLLEDLADLSKNNLDVIIPIFSLKVAPAVIYGNQTFYLEHIEWRRVDEFKSSLNFNDDYPF